MGVVGGLIGTVIIGVTAVAVRPLGVLLVMLLMLAGQLVAAVGLDALDPQTRGHITPPWWSGCSSPWGRRHWPAWPEPAPPGGRGPPGSPTRPWQDRRS